MLSAAFAPVCPCHPGRLHAGRLSAAEFEQRALENTLAAVGRHGSPKQPRITVVERVRGGGRVDPAPTRKELPSFSSPPSHLATAGKTELLSAFLNAPLRRNNPEKSGSKKKDTHFQLTLVVGMFELELQYLGMDGKLKHGNQCTLFLPPGKQLYELVTEV